MIALVLSVIGTLAWWVVAFQPIGHYVTESENDYVTGGILVRTRFHKQDDARRLKNRKRFWIALLVWLVLVLASCPLGRKVLVLHLSLLVLGLPAVAFLTATFAERVSGSTPENREYSTGWSRFLVFLRPRFVFVAGVMLCYALAVLLLRMTGECSPTLPLAGILCR